ncbi:hypothetical protein JZ751_028514, partial [Albula glossodonta]
PLCLCVSLCLCSPSPSDSVCLSLSKGDHAPLHEAVYEEIEYKLAREGTYSAPRWGSVLSEDPPSGYEDVGDSEGHSLSGKG